jgi:uncharacterized protein (UPF0147 family)
MSDYLSGWMAGIFYAKAEEQVNRALEWKIRKDTLPRYLSKWSEEANKILSRGGADWVRRDLHMWIFDFEYNDPEVPAFLRSIVPADLLALIDDPKAVPRWDALREMMDAREFRGTDDYYRLCNVLHMTGKIPEDESAVLIARLDQWIAEHPKERP